jgi:hypothetical protein
MNPRKILFCIVWLSIIQSLSAQTSTSSVCNTAVGICSSTNYSFPAGVNAGNAVSGPDYGCLKKQPNPAWFFLQMQNSGKIVFTMTSSPARDIDYIIWGPFSSPSASCASGLTTSKIVSCSYSTASTETATIPNGQNGEYYILLITNYSNNTTNISFAQTSGSGSSNCDILCNISSLTANVSSCQTGSNLGKYTVTGTINTFTPPNTGTLTISSSDGASVTYEAPFGTSLNYALPGVAGHGDTCIITAVYSKVNSCTRSVSAVAPKCCSVNANPSISVCESQDLTLSSTGTTGGTYNWTGPSGYSSSQQNPVIPRVATSSGGLYQVSLTNGACTTPKENVNVTIKPKPAAKNIVHQ